MGRLTSTRVFLHCNVSPMPAPIALHALYTLETLLPTRMPCMSPTRPPPPPKFKENPHMHDCVPAPTRREGAKPGTACPLTGGGGGRAECPSSFSDLQLQLLWMQPPHLPWSCFSIVGRRKGWNAPPLHLLVPFAASSSSLGWGKLERQPWLGFSPASNRKKGVPLPRSSIHFAGRRLGHKNHFLFPSATARHYISPAAQEGAINIT